MRHMFVVAHPDDEVLGAGAFIHKAVNAGDEVSVVIMNADYEKTRKEMYSDISKSHKHLGIENVALFTYRNMDFINENHREMVESIEEEMRSFKPDNIFTHDSSDLHSDHMITSMLTQQAARLWQRHSRGYKVRALYFMEILSSTNWSYSTFTPDTYINITKQDLQAEIESLKEYTNVVRETPHPRSVEAITALAILRGSEAGFQYAKAFKTCWRDSL